MRACVHACVRTVAQRLTLECSRSHARTLCGGVHCGLPVCSRIDLTLCALVYLLALVLSFAVMFEHSVLYLVVVCVCVWQCNNQRPIKTVQITDCGQISTA